LTAGARDAPTRQRTLRETLTWSYDLLAPDEQSIFRSASIFAGGFTLEAIEKVGLETDAGCPSQDSRTSVLDSVMSLVEQSLVRPDASRDDSPRFSMLETVREFGLERLAASNEIERVQRRHVNWCVTLAESAIPHYHGPHVFTVLDQLETESDNFRLALAWSIERNESQTALRLAYGLWRFWWMHGHLSEGRSWLERALATSGPAPPDLRSKVLAATGYFARIQGDFERAHELGEQGIALARRHDDYHAMSGALDLLGLISFDRGDHKRATAFHAEALALDRQQENAHRIAVHCYNLAVNSLATGDLDQAEAYFEETLSIWKSRDDAWGTARALIGLGRLASARGDFAATTELLFESIALSQSVGDKEQVANSLTELASLTVSGNAVKAATLFGAAEALRIAIGAPISPADRARHDESIASVRKRLSEDAFQTAWQAGVALASEDAIVQAIRQFKPAAKPRSVAANEPTG
jgi:tetratricopeptide (TPR) repeat protein